MLCKRYTGRCVTVRYPPRAGPTPALGGVGDGSTDGARGAEAITQVRWFPAERVRHDKRRRRAMRDESDDDAASDDDDDGKDCKRKSTTPAPCSTPRAKAPTDDVATTRRVSDAAADLPPKRIRVRRQFYQ